MYDALASHTVRVLQNLCHGDALLYFARTTCAMVRHLNLPFAQQT